MAICSQSLNYARGRRSGDLSAAVFGRVGAVAPRVELMTSVNAPLLARPYFAEAQPDPIIAALAQVPELLSPALPFLGAALGPSFVPIRAKEIVILRTSALLECEYCIGAHTVVACDSGLSPEEVHALRGDTEWADTFAAPPEQALLGWIDGVALGRGAVPEARFRDLHTHWNDAEIVELTLLVGATMMLNRFCTALELPLGPDTMHRLIEDGFA